MRSSFVINNYLTIFQASLSLFTLEVRHLAKNQYIAKILRTSIAITIYNREIHLLIIILKITGAVSPAVAPKKKRRRKNAAQPPFCNESLQKKIIVSSH